MALTACPGSTQTDGGTDVATDTGHDSGTPDTGTPDTGTPDTGTPDTGTPDTGTPDTGTPDTGTPDTGTPDTGVIDDTGTGVDVIDTDTGMDAAMDDVESSTDSGTPDTGVDVPPVDAGPTCPTDNPYATRAATALSPWIQYENLDQTCGGVSAHAFASIILPNNFTTPQPPDQMSGDCAYWSLGKFGNAAVNAAPDRNLGTLTISQSTGFLATYTYNTTTGHYTTDLTMAQNPTAGLPTTLTVAGGADGPPGAAVQLLPPALPCTDVFFQSSYPAATDIVIDWTPPANVAPDQLIRINVADLTSRAKRTMCYVPACWGSVTIPADLVANYTSGETLIMQFTLSNELDVTPPQDAATYILHNGTAFTTTIQ